MKIAELELHHAQFLEIETHIETSLEKRDIAEVFSACQASFSHIIPAIRFRKRRDIHPEIPRLMAFDVICKYAPPLFEHSAINALSEFLRSSRVLARNTDYSQSVESALEREEAARAIWNHLEQNPGLLQRDIQKDLGIKQEVSVPILTVWDQLGVVDQEKKKDSCRLSFHTNLDEVVGGVCRHCGVRGKARKEVFFKKMSCKKCGSQGYYHILNSQP